MNALNVQSSSAYADIRAAYLPFSNYYHAVEQVNNRGIMVDVQVDNVDGTVGLRLDPADSNILWAVYRDAPRNRGGVIKLDLEAKSNLTLFDGVPSGGSTKPNDVEVAYIGGEVYYTDTSKFLVFKLTPKGDRDSDSYNSEIIARNICIDCTPGSENGPNGIVLYPNTDQDKPKVALVSIYPGPVSKYSAFVSIDLHSLKVTNISVSPSSLLLNYDGLTFDSEQEFLFAASNTHNYISALYSCDGWTKTAIVAQTFSAGCDVGDVSTMAYTSNGELILNCLSIKSKTNTDFRTTRIPDIRKRILGDDYTSASQLCGIEPNSGGGSNEDDDEQQTINNLSGVIGVLVFIVFLLNCYIFYNIYNSKLAVKAPLASDHQL